MAESGLLLKRVPASLGLGGTKLTAPFEQGHLGRQVAALTDFHHSMGGNEIDVITASITAGTHEPEGAGRGHGQGAH